MRICTSLNQYCYCSILAKKYIMKLKFITFSSMGFSANGGCSSAQCPLRLYAKYLGLQCRILHPSRLRKNPGRRHRNPMPGRGSRLSTSRTIRTCTHRVALRTLTIYCTAGPMRFRQMLIFAPRTQNQSLPMGGVGKPRHIEEQRRGGPMTMTASAKIFAIYNETNCLGTRIKNSANRDVLEARSKLEV